LGGQGRLGSASFKRSRKPVRPTKCSSTLPPESPPLGGRWKRVEKNQAIGRSRGGRSTKIHALTHAQCRPLAFVLTGGQVADLAAGALLLRTAFQIAASCTPTRAMTPRPSAARSSGPIPNIPLKANRKWKNCFSPFLYRSRKRHRAHVPPPQGLQAHRHTDTTETAANFLAAVLFGDLLLVMSSG